MTTAAGTTGKTALVLEGGSFRCQFTAGVLDVLMENGITFDACYGVSAGTPLRASASSPIRSVAPTA